MESGSDLLLGCLGISTRNGIDSDRGSVMRESALLQFAMVMGEGVAYLVSGAVTFVLIARVGGVELLGQYALVLAWVTTFQALGNFGIPEFILREIGTSIKDGNRHFRHGLIIGLCSSFLSMIAMATVVKLVVYPPEVEKALFLSTLTLVPAIASAICRGGFLAHKRGELVFFLGFVECLLVVAVNIYLVIHGFGIVYLVLALVGGKLLFSTFSLYLLNVTVIPLRGHFDLSHTKNLLPPIFAFALSTILGILSIRLNIIILSKLSSVYTVGVYAVANKVVEVALMIPNTFTQLMLPQLAKGFSVSRTFERKTLEGTLRCLFGLIIPLGMGLFFFAKPLVEKLFGEQFSDSILILRILIFYFFIESADAVMGVILKAAGRQKTDVYLFATNPTVNTVLNFILIPPLGGVGVALSKLVGGLCSSSLRYAVISKLYLQLNWSGICSKPLLTCTALIASMVSLSGHVPMVALGLIYLAVTGVLFYRIIISRPGNNNRSRDENLDHEIFHQNDSSRRRGY